MSSAVISPKSTPSISSSGIAGNWVSQSPTNLRTRAIARRHLSYHERRKDHGERIAIDGAVVAGPVAAAVVVQPSDIVERDALQFALRRKPLRTIRHQALDDALAGFLMIRLVASYRKEAFA